MVVQDIKNSFYDNTPIVMHNEFYKVLGFFRYKDDVLLTFKSLKENRYSFVGKDCYRLYGFHNVDLPRPDSNPNYKNDSYLKIDDDYYFKVMCDFNDSFYGYLLDKEHSRVHEMKGCADLKKCDDYGFVLLNADKYRDNIAEYIPKLITSNEDLLEVLPYESDFKIIKHLKHPIYFDYLGTLRFREQEFSDIEKIMDSDINQAWRDYYDGKYKFSDMITWYMKMGYSVDGFMEIFYSSFCIEDSDNDISELCPEEEIVEILNNEMKSYDK